MSTLRRTPIYRALHRPQLLLGGDRELVLVSGLLCFGLAAAAVNVTAIVVGTLLWFVCLALLRRIARADPDMRRVYARYLRYRSYYPARSRPYRQE
jgi:type IV secretory pathway TrbD component